MVGGNTAFGGGARTTGNRHWVRQQYSTEPHRTLTGLEPRDYLVEVRERRLGKGETARIAVPNFAKLHARDRAKVAKERMLVRRMETGFETFRLGKERGMVGP